MKKSIIAILISVTLVISAVVAACGQPTAITPGAVTAPPQPNLARPEYRPLQEKQLDEIRLQTVLAIELSPSASTSQRAGMYTALQQIEDAQRSLSGLDETRGMLAAVMANRGASVDEIDAALGAIEDARQAVLASVGLAY